MILVRFPSTRYLANEVSMPFLIRPCRRFPVCCPVTYHCADFEGHGLVWNLSVNGETAEPRTRPHELENSRDFPFRA